MRAGNAPLHWPLTALQAAVKPLADLAHVEVLPTIDSTNSELMRRARLGDTRPVCWWPSNKARAEDGRAALGRGSALMRSPFLWA
jgi:BirA family biotin operon repressor/biotin-[acetyl-CoA-carboxylase] ligase